MKKHRKIKVSFTCECGREISNAFIDSVDESYIENMECECGTSYFATRPKVYNTFDPTVMEVNFYCDCGALLYAYFNYEPELGETFEDCVSDNVECPICEAYYEVDPPFNSVPKKEK